MKTIRHAAILKLIQENVVETQEELARLLKDHGYQVTQATVSRDIKELRLTKLLDEAGVYRYASMEKSDSFSTNIFMRMFTSSVTSIVPAGNLVVIKTLSGSAMAAAEAIDTLKWTDVIGSIAGDNTIFVAASSEEGARTLADKLKNMLR